MRRLDGSPPLCLALHPLKQPLPSFVMMMVTAPLCPLSRPLPPLWPRPPPDPPPYQEPDGSPPLLHPLHLRLALHPLHLRLALHPLKQSLPPSVLMMGSAPRSLASPSTVLPPEPPDPLDIPAAFVPFRFYFTSTSISQAKTRISDLDFPTPTLESRSCDAPIHLLVLLPRSQLLSLYPGWL